MFRPLRLLSLSALLIGGTAAPLWAVTPEEVVDTYGRIAEATFEDGARTAETLRAAVAAFVAAPSDATLTAARAAWIEARVPYQQSEVFRFGNAIVDDWEGRVNAWPLDEGFLDYVEDGTGENEDNPHAALNIVANPRFSFSGTEIDASQITPALIAGQLHEADGVDANVASGYHAIEFFLWGQDLNFTGPGAGNRPFTDYVQGDGCTNGHCDRRAAYLVAVTDLLVADMQEMAANWREGGAARISVSTDAKGTILKMLTGMGSLSYGELAGERMKLGLMLNDPEEEQDCFSDNTHNSHYYDGIGIRNIYTGSYTRADGRVISGPSLSQLVAEKDPSIDATLRAELDATVAALGAIKTAAENGMAYDQMLEPGNDQGEALILTAVDALVTQTGSIERAVAALGLSKIELEGSDSLDNPGTVLK